MSRIAVTDLLLFRLFVRPWERVFTMVAIVTYQRDSAMRPCSMPDSSQVRGRVTGEGKFSEANLLAHVKCCDDVVLYSQWMPLRDS